MGGKPAGVAGRGERGKRGERPYIMGCVSYSPQSSSEIKSKMVSTRGIKYIDEQLSLDRNLRLRCILQKGLF